MKLMTLVVALCACSVAYKCLADLDWPASIAADVEAAQNASIPSGDRAAYGEQNAFSSFGCAPYQSPAYGTPSERFDSFCWISLLAGPISVDTTAPGFLLFFR